MRGPQIEFLEGTDALGPEHRIFEARFAVLATEEEPEGMFGIAGASAVAAADADAGVDLKPRTTVGIDEFKRGGAFPIAAVVAGVRVNAGGRVEQVCEVCRERKRRDRLERLFDGGGAFGTHDRLIHSVIDDVVAPRRRPARRRDARGRIAASDIVAGRLQNDIVQEEISPRNGRQGDEAGFEGLHAQSGRRGNGQRTRINGTVAFGRIASVCGVADGGSGSWRRERYGKRTREKAGVNARRDRFDDPERRIRIDCAGSRRPEIFAGTLGDDVADQLRQDEKAAVGGRDVEAVNGQDIVARLQQIEIRRERNSFDRDGLGDRALGRGH